MHSIANVTSTIILADVTIVTRLWVEEMTPSLRVYNLYKFKIKERRALVMLKIWNVYIAILKLGFDSCLMEQDLASRAGTKAVTPAPYLFRMVIRGMSWKERGHAHLTSP